MLTRGAPGLPLPPPTAPPPPPAPTPASGSPPSPAESPAFRSPFTPKTRKGISEGERRNHGQACRASGTYTPVRAAEGQECGEKGRRVRAFLGLQGATEQTRPGAGRGLRLRPSCSQLRETHLAPPSPLDAPAALKIDVLFGVKSLGQLAAGVTYLRKITGKNNLEIEIKFLPKTIFIL